MKGVSTIITIVLILMIVVALAALAYTWFTGIFATITGTTETAVTTTTTAMGVQFRLESAKFNQIGATGYVNFTIRNTGSQDFDANKTAAYIAGVPCTDIKLLDCTPTCTDGILVPGGIASISAKNETTACGRALKVTVETGLSDTKDITC
jgi:FlaG/FlaF family flagellin (archaellin)